MVCSHEIFTDQIYHACIRSEKIPSIRSDACMTADYARARAASQPARGHWPASPVELTAIYIRLRARIITLFLSGWSGPWARMWLQSNVLLCVRRSCTVHHQNLFQNVTFCSRSNRAALYSSLTCAEFCGDLSLSLLRSMTQKIARSPAAKMQALT